MGLTHLTPSSQRSLRFAAARPSSHWGLIQIRILTDDDYTTDTLHDVLYAPTIGLTLISLSRADKASYSTLIRDGNLHILD